MGWSVNCFFVSMKNFKLFKISFLVSLTLVSTILTGCGSDNGKASKSSTKACPYNAYYNPVDGEWYNSRSDLTICNPLPDVQPEGCGVGEVIVRSPYSYDVNYDPRTTDFRNVSNNYHNINGSYREICMAIGGAGWSHVSYGGFYYYVNLGLLNASFNTGLGVQYTTTYTYNTHRSSNNTGAALLALGVLAALFLAN